MSDWYAKGKAGLIGWAEAVPVGARADVASSPLARALACVEAADELVVAVRQGDAKHMEKALADYTKARGTR